MEQLSKQKWKKIAIPVIAAILSVVVIMQFATSPKFHEKTIKSLDDKKTTVMELAAASAASSAILSAMPGDAGTPIAEKLVDLSSYFLIVLCAIFLEKYLLTIIGYASFGILIPAGCAMYVVYILKQNQGVKKLANKLIAFAIAISLVIPVSVKISDSIEHTYETSIQSTIDGVSQSVEEIEGEDEKTSDKKKSNAILEFFSGLKDDMTEGAQNIKNKLEVSLNQFIEAIAVLIVTSCIIPIVVLLFFVWLIKVILGVDISIPKRIK